MILAVLFPGANIWTIRDFNTPELGPSVDKDTLHSRVTSTVIPTHKSLCPWNLKFHYDDVSMGSFKVQCVCVCVCAYTCIYMYIRMSICV